MGGWELWNDSLRYSKLRKYYLSIQMDVAQDLIYTASSYMYSEILMILFSN